MVLKFENDFEISEFYPSRIFVKVEKWGDFFENFKFSGKYEQEGLLPFEFPER